MGTPTRINADINWWYYGSDRVEFDSRGRVTGYSNRGGRLKLKQYGAPGVLTPFYNKLLREDLGVEIEVIAGVIISGKLLRYAKYYNALMTREIERKYSPGILQVAMRKAQIMHAQVQRDSRR